MIDIQVKNGSNDPLILEGELFESPDDENLYIIPENSNPLVSAISIKRLITDWQHNQKIDYTIPITVETNTRVLAVILEGGYINFALEDFYTDAIIETIRQLI